MLGLLITVGQAIVYVLTGMYGEPSEVGTVNAILIVLQVPPGRRPLRGPAPPPCVPLCWEWCVCAGAVECCTAMYCHAAQPTPRGCVRAARPAAICGWRAGAAPGRDAEQRVGPGLRHLPLHRHQHLREHRVEGVQVGGGSCGVQGKGAPVGWLHLEGGGCRRRLVGRMLPVNGLVGRCSLAWVADV